MAATISSLGLATIAPLIEQQFNSVVFRNEGKEFFGLFPNIGLRGGNTYDFPIKVTGNGSAATFTEGTALPVAGQGTTVLAQSAYTHYRSVANVTGHAMDAARGLPLANAAIADELTDARLAVQDLLTNTLYADAATGLLGLVDDSTTNLHGLSRATYTALTSHVEAGGSAALSLAMMQNTWEAVRDNDRAGKPSIILMAVSMVTNYLNIAPQQASGGTTPINVNQWQLDGGRAYDLGADWNNVRFNGIPIVGLPDFVDTEVVFLDLAPGNWEYVEHRPFTIEQYAKVDDSETYVVSYSSTLALRKPRQQGKIEAVTA